jgi:hypothetical protein
VDDEDVIADDHHGVVIDGDMANRVGLVQLVHGSPKSYSILFVAGWESKLGLTLGLSRAE